jgi:hypothetical protein
MGSTAVANDMTLCARVQVVLCEREHGGGGGQKHLQAPGAGRGLVAHLIPLFLQYNLIVQEHHTNTNQYMIKTRDFLLLKGTVSRDGFSF